MAHYPGFDTGSYPGDNAMTEWAQNSPYKWAGFYLDAPCHSAAAFTPWAGKYTFLRDLGWGLAVLYVGLQQSGCGAAHLSREKGALHGGDAVTKCRKEGFPQDCVIYLDVEHFDGAISGAMKDYYQGWIGAVLESNSFKPGTYSAASNFADVYNAAQQEYANHGEPRGGPSMWIVKHKNGFDPVGEDPTGCGISQANLWQGMLDINETHGTVALRIDQNTADSEDPSRTKAALV